MAKVHVYPETMPPNLDVEDAPHDRIDSMVSWFFENFGESAEDLPNPGGAEGSEWLKGPFDAADELASAFPDVPSEERTAAVDIIQQDGVIEWWVSASRVADLPEYTYEYDGKSERDLPPSYDSHRDTIVETTLLPRRMFDWSVHVTFIPLRTNAPHGEVATMGLEGGGYGRDDFQFESLRHVVSTLIGQKLVGVQVGHEPDLEQSYEWLRSLDNDRDLFVDDAVIIHHSPPEWLPLKEMFKHGTVGGVAFISQSPGHWTGVMLMYGGTLLFLRLVKNLNFVQDAFFERWAKRIRKDDNNPF